MILLDTDVVVDILRGYLPATAWLESLERQPLVLPGFVAAELVLGCSTRDQQRSLIKFLSSYRVVWPDTETCDQAFAVFVEYHLSHGLGIFDALVGQTAVDMRQSLHTFNTKHYACIPGLHTVQPYRR